MKHDYLKRLICLFALMAAPAMAELSNDELQTEIIRFYSEGHCEQVKALESQVVPKDLRPNVLAIFAYCEPDGQDPEKLFAMAEEESPTGDLILVLHGKYRWKKNKQSSVEIWEKVLMLARIEHFRILAHAYLANAVSDEYNLKPLDLSPNTGFVRLSLGGEYKEQANTEDFSFDHTGPVYGGIFQGDLIYRHWTVVGNMSYHYQTKLEMYDAHTQYNSWTNSFEAPLAIHVDTGKDIIFRPVIGYDSIGGESFDFNYGLGVKGAVYNSGYVQSVEALVYSKLIYNDRISAETGSHYRFNYEWDFYPLYWFISSQWAVEHVSTSDATNYLGTNGNFSLSHNDISLDLKFHRDFSHFTVGFDPKILTRIDTAASTYVDTTKALISKDRKDWEFHLNGNLTIPVLPAFQLYVWYEWTKIISTYGPTDYVNRNYTNQTVGVALKTWLSTY
jgi:hypothetical protein